MKKQAFNPYLPGYEYIPDGEPHVFGDRVYVYGSHDRFRAGMFCLNDYVCWSAPSDDLSDWRYEGVIFGKNQDPKNRLGLRLLFAPDVTRGADGRYYLYYALDFLGIMGVAVCGTPAGKYEFLGHVRHKNGMIWGRKKGDSFPFDPGVLTDEDGSVYLYSGFYTQVPGLLTGGKRLKFEGGYVLELERDMVTIKTPEKLLFPKAGKGAFGGHEFFEASSIRRYEGKYYFVYSSRKNHELCFAVSDRPDEGFVYGGVLVSNCDVGVNGIADESRAANYAGNNHGGMLYLNGQYYIFYHRHTYRTSYSRQTCAELLRRSADGSFCQAEMTSCGLNGAPLRGEGRYEARIACNLWSSEGTGRYDVKRAKKKYEQHPYFTQDKRDGDTTAVQYIANMRDGAVAGFKYFALKSLKAVHLELKGEASGKIVVALDREFKEIAAEIPVQTENGRQKTFSGGADGKDGVYPLYFKYMGKGKIDFIAFILETQEEQ